MPRVDGLSFNAMAMEYQELEGLFVRVDQVVYMPELDAPVEKPYPFVYFITIQNDSAERVQVLGRKWVVDESVGEVTVVEGEGVVGQNPVLDPGTHFAYNSYHVVASNALVRGAFFGVSASGENVKIPIPPFSLEVPK